MILRCFYSYLISYFVLDIFELISATDSSLTVLKTCDPLLSFKNVFLSCSSSQTSYSNYNSSQNDLNERKEVGTVCKYKCKQWYVPLDTSKDLPYSGTEFESEVIKCDKSGSWLGLEKYQAFRCKEDCGRVIRDAKPFVVNGVETTREQNPWHATLYYEFNSEEFSGWGYLCGGSIIRSQVVLTAAHCVNNSIISDVKKLRVVVGGISSNFNENTPETGTRIYPVQRVYIPESYDPEKDYQADIAVLHLDGVMEYNENILPICLPNDYNADISVVKNGIEGVVVGFGVTENLELSKVLRSVKLNVKTNSECFNSLSRVLSESQYCAGGERDNKIATVCNGDSGGGMIFFSSVNEKYFIHGLVSTGDADSRKGICQNYAVFTRVYPFVFWIRDVIEEISGEIARDLAKNVPYPYIFQGTERELNIFNGLPREWENRVTRLEINYASLNTSTIFNSLEVSKPITTLQLSHISLQDKQNFNKRVVLPLLSSFHLDLIYDHLKINNSHEFPTPLTEEYLKSFLFFDKEYGATKRNWKLSDILLMQVDVELILSIFKLMSINKEKGEVFMQQVPMANDILERWKINKGPELNFVMKHLALHKCSINFNNILPAAKTMSSITLSDFKIMGDSLRSGLRNKSTSYQNYDKNIEEESPFEFLSKFTALESLILSPFTDNKLKLNLAYLPRSLSVLSINKKVILTNYVKNLTHDKAQSHHDSIIFPSDKEVIKIQRSKYPTPRALNTNGRNLNMERYDLLRSMTQLVNLEEFYCNFCEIDENILKNFSSIFQNLKKIILRSSQVVDLEHVLKIPRLEWIFLESNSKRLENFKNLNLLKKESSVDLNYSVLLIQIRKSEWEMEDVTNKGKAHYKYMSNGLDSFWTSEEDFFVKKRLKSFEREAFRSNSYEFSGYSNKETFNRISLGEKFQFEIFKGIPQEIQPSLKSISLKSTQITPNIFYNSLINSTSLKNLKLNNITVLGSSQRYSFSTPSLIEYKIDSVGFSDFSFEFVYEFVNGKLAAALIPFQHVGRFRVSNSANTLVRLLENINSIRLEPNRTVMYLFDSTMGEFRANMAHIRKTISSLDKSHPLSSLLKNLLEIHSAFKASVLPEEWELNGLNVIDTELVHRFYDDRVTRVLGDLGVLRFLLKRFGRFLSLASLSLTALQNKNGTASFPPLQAIGLSLILDKIK